MGLFKYSRWDFVFTCLGLVFLLYDIVSDILAVRTFYEEKAYLCLCIMVVLLLGSSVLVQAFSWLWYSYEDYERETTVEKIPSVTVLKLLHVLQLGIYIRHAGVVELALFSLHPQSPASREDFTVYLSHDLSMLRLMETFAESAPQLVLLLAVMLQQGSVDVFIVMKAIGSASAIGISVTMYHRSLRSFLPEKRTQGKTSSLVYFLWNVTLVSSRVTALALFASVLPCFIFTHFICSWLVLFFFAWRSKTDFMESPCGEWLYRATVGLIWYFNWFNVVDGSTRHRTVLYHGYILADIVLLSSVWCWKTLSTEPPYFQISLAYGIVTAFIVVVFYILGLLLKLLYYRRFHPNLAKEELKGDTVGRALIRQESPEIRTDNEEEVDGFPTDVEEDGHHIPRMALQNVREEEPTGVTYRCDFPSEPERKHCNKRMRKLAENFYS